MEREWKVGPLLFYQSSKSIFEFIKDNPVSWLDIDLAQRHGYCDRATGTTPTPAVYEFHQFLGERGFVFTQEEYIEWCLSQPAWVAKYTTPEAVRAITSKLRCNFFISQIDMLHAWALLLETKIFKVCLVDVHKDVLGGVDMTVVGYEGAHIPIALLGPNAKKDREFKLKHRTRGQEVVHCVEVQLPRTRERSLRTGNKKWYEIGDFNEVIKSACAAPVVLPVVRREVAPLISLSSEERCSSCKKPIAAGDRNCLPGLCNQCLYEQLK
jgi:hypothetical protein